MFSRVTTASLGLIILTFLCFYTTWCDGAKILGCPFAIFKHSSLRNNEKILAMLAERGHEVFILADDHYNPPEFVVKAGIKLITFPRPKDAISTHAKFSLKDLKEGFTSKAMNLMSQIILNCESFLNSSDIHERLRRENFDLVFYDGILTCKFAIHGVLKARIPSVEFLALDVIWRLESRELPYPISYLPQGLLSSGQDMTFLQRVLNTALYVFVAGFTYKTQNDVMQISRKYNVEPLQPESLGFVFGGFPMDYPAPILPDIVYLNGILAAQPKPLDQDILNFVESSGDDGLIIMSLGSLVDKYDEHHGNMLAEAFSKVPQKVLWKYEGPTPKTLGKNTKLVKWFPQSGLLAHPKTKAFFTHCGLNSAYETVMFGVPVIAMPLFNDQPQNAARLTLSHKAGVLLDFKTLTVDGVVDAIKEVTTNPIYKQNVVRLSSYLNDQPITGKDLLFYWTEYVIRHKGVGHLKPYGRFLPWYQFYSIDVAVFLALLLGLVCSLFYCTCKCCYGICCKRNLKSKRE